MKIWGIIVSLLVLLSACSGEDATTPTDAPNTPDTPTIAATEESAAVPQDAEPALPLTEDGVQVVARVNGEAITLPEFEQALARSRQPRDAETFEIVAEYELDILIQQQLINQAAEALNITVSEEEIDAEYQETRGRVTSDTEWSDWLAQNNFSEAEFRQSLRDALITTRLIDTITQPSDGAVDEVNARHIVVDDPALAEDILAQLQNGGDFEALAAEHSKDITTREQGGDLGWFTRDGLLVPELAEVAFSLQPDELTGPVETLLGYHIIQTLEFGQRDLNEAEQAEDAADQFAEWLQEQQTEAEIERYIEY